jgi:hypothetical protein
MLNVHLIRFQAGDYGTKGIWATPGFMARTIELPWKNNANSVSCIPDGKYKVKVRISKKYGKVYHITNVEGRTWILTHSGNWAGNRSLGLRCHSEGCVLLGKYHAMIIDQVGVAVSKPTVRRWMQFTGGAEFKLHVTSIDQPRVYDQAA